MSTRSDPRHGRGGPWLAALGLVLVAAGLITAGLLPRSPDTRTEPDVSARVSLPPFVVEPAVVLERARTTASPYAGVPERLLVPALGVDAPVIPIGMRAGTLLPPSDPQVLGWWTGGAPVGAKRGGAVLTGHTVHTGGGAFDDLDRLRPGDVARVRTGKGTIGYRVSAVTIYRKASLAADARRVFSQSVPGRLVLVTCSDWDGTTYLSNTVVFAERVPGST